MTRYGFRRAVGGFFAADTAGLRKRLPPGLFPVEVRPGQAVLAVTVFDFVESEVGAYGEIVISAVVPPFASRADELPDAAFFPLVLATTTPASRRHAAERWHLPEYGACVDVSFVEGDDHVEVGVHEAGDVLLRLRVARTVAAPSSRLYQCFSRAGDVLWRVPIRILGPLDEHEEERGRLELSDSHPLTRDIAALLEDPTPFREQVMGAGEQRFGELVAQRGERA